MSGGKLQVWAFCLPSTKNAAESETGRRIPLRFCQTSVGRLLESSFSLVRPHRTFHLCSPRIPPPAPSVPAVSPNPFCFPPPPPQQITKQPTCCTGRCRAATRSCWGCGWCPARRSRPSSRPGRRPSTPAAPTGRSSGSGSSRPGEPHTHTHAHMGTLA